MVPFVILENKKSDNITRDCSIYQTDSYGRREYTELSR